MSQNQSETNYQVWQGRFEQSVDELVILFNESISFDYQLAPYDIQLSLAHSQMLAQCNIITQKVKEEIHQGLKTIQKEIQSNEFNWNIQLEDVHMNIEARLVELIGENGKKLHTARSRNDQVATDIRLYLKDNISKQKVFLKELLQSLVKLASEHTQTIMPSFTHLQAAQPISFAHHILAWFEMFKRDYKQLDLCLQSVDCMPLGSGALAGVNYPIDRTITAKILNFSTISQNSLDGVSDRDFIMDYIFMASKFMIHCSRISEEIILWLSEQFKFIDLPDRLCTGSSIMPQKKNPDICELLRGKSARVLGNLINILTLMKSQPLAYNKDNQEDKEGLFDTVSTLNKSIKVMSMVIQNIQPISENMQKAALEGYTTATDLADYLVKKGLSFRDCHKIVGQIVRYGIEQKQKLNEISLDKLKKFSDLIEQDIYTVLSLEGSVQGKNHTGGTAIPQVQANIELAKKFINQLDV